MRQQLILVFQLGSSHHMGFLCMSFRALNMLDSENANKFSMGLSMIRKIH